MEQTPYDKVKMQLLELNFQILNESEQDGVFVIANQEKAIANAVIVLADPLLVIEQYICEVNSKDPEIYKNLLIKNRDIIHGAFVLDETGQKLIFKNTHELSTISANELEATFNALSILLSEYSKELVQISKK